MKSILISIKPKWVAKILNGEKTIEIRTSKALANAIQKLIDEYGYADICAYCTKSSDGLVWDNNGKGLVNAKLFPYSKGSPEHDRLLNGKVPFKFRCYKVEEILITPHGNYYTNTLSNNKLQTQSCLSNIEIFKYTNCHITIYGYCVCGYVIHISNLEIFDEPKELSEFYKYTDNKMVSGMSKVRAMRSLTKAPQSWCYVESEE